MWTTLKSSQKSLKKISVLYHHRAQFVIRILFSVELLIFLVKVTPQIEWIVRRVEDKNTIKRSNVLTMQQRN